MGGKNSGRTSEIDIIKDALVKDYNTPIHELPLSDAQKEALERWYYIHDLMRSRSPLYPKKEIRILTMRKFGISEPQYYLDRKNAIRLLGTCTRDEKLMKRNLYVEWLEQAMAMAFDTKDLSILPGIFKNLITLQGLDKLDDEEERDTGPRNFQLVINVNNDQGEKEQFTYDLMELNKLKSKELQGVIDIATAPDVDVNVMEKLLDEE